MGNVYNFVWIYTMNELMLFQKEVRHMPKKCSCSICPGDIFHSKYTHTSFIIMSNKGRLPALGLGAERPDFHSK